MKKWLCLLVMVFLCACVEDDRSRATGGGGGGYTEEPTCPTLYVGSYDFNLSLIHSEHEGCVEEIRFTERFDGESSDNCILILDDRTCTIRENCVMQSDDGFCVQLVAEYKVESSVRFNGELTMTFYTEYSQTQCRGTRFEHCVYSLVATHL